MRDDDARAKLGYARDVLGAWTARRRAAGVAVPFELQALLAFLSVSERLSASSLGCLPPNRLLLSYDEAAEVLGVSASTLTRLVKDGRLPTVAVGGGRIAAQDLQTFVDTLPRRHGPAAGAVGSPRHASQGDCPERARRPQYDNEGEAA